MQGNEILSRKSSMTSRISSAITRRLSCPFLNEQVKQNQLQWKYNRRKQKLQQTSAENIQLYLRINSQKSGLSAILNKKLNFQPPKTSRLRMAPTQRQRNKQKQNIYMENQFKKRNKQIDNIIDNLNLNLNEQLKMTKNFSKGQFVVRKML